LPPNATVMSRTSQTIWPLVSFAAPIDDGAGDGDATAGQIIRDRRRGRYRSISPRAVVELGAGVPGGISVSDSDASAKVRGAPLRSSDVADEWRAPFIAAAPRAALQFGEPGRTKHLFGVDAFTKNRAGARFLRC